MPNGLVKPKNGKIFILHLLRYVAIYGNVIFISVCYIYVWRMSKIDHGWPASRTPNHPFWGRISPSFICDVCNSRYAAYALYINYSIYIFISNIYIHIHAGIYIYQCIYIYILYIYTYIYIYIILCYIYRGYLTKYQKLTGQVWNSTPEDEVRLAGLDGWSLLVPRLFSRRMAGAVDRWWKMSKAGRFHWNDTGFMEDCWNDTLW